MLAVQEDQQSVIDIMISMVGAQDPSLSQSFIKACIKGKLDLIKRLHGVGADINAFDQKGWTALMYACLEGHEKIAEYLIKMGADLNATNENGSTALMKASQKGFENIVEMLVSAKAEVSTVNKSK